MGNFRFEDLEIWHESLDLGDMMFDIADIAENKRHFRFAEQLRSSGMSISNNIAEGSGSFSDKEFRYFLNISRRSVFECANILTIFYRRKINDDTVRQSLLTRLAILSRKITTFRKKLSE